ncbi:MAG: TIGR04376 family protein [Microcystaceae cyanobacterium]
MGVFDEFSRFLETRLEEFLRNNPDLELQALLEQLREQDQDARRLLQRLGQQKDQQEQEILNLAQDIKTWHNRIEKAKQAGRLDLAQAAQEREAALLHQGNLVWGQRANVGEQIIQTQSLLTQIQQRQKEVVAKIELAKQQKTSTATPNSDTVGWNQGNQYKNYQRSLDPLEATFKNWELDDDLENLKRKMGR